MFFATSSPSAVGKMLVAVAACMLVVASGARAQCATLSTTSWPFCKFYPASASIEYTGGTMANLFAQINATLSKVAKTPVVTRQCEQAAETILCLNTFHLCTTIGSTQTPLIPCVSTCVNQISYCSAAAIGIFARNVSDTSKATLTALCTESNSICQCTSRVGSDMVQISLTCSASASSITALSLPTMHLTLFLAVCILAALF